MATFRKRRSMKYRNTRRTKNRRNTRRKSHIKRRGKKSLVGGGGGGWLRFMKRPRNSIHHESTATDKGATDELVVEEAKQIQQLIKDIEAEIQKTANVNFDTTSLKEVVSNIETTSALFKCRYIELVSFVSDREDRSALIKVANDIHDILISAIEYFAPANISQNQGIAKMQLYKLVNSHYEQLIRISNMLLLHID